MFHCLRVRGAVSRWPMVPLMARHDLSLEGNGSHGSQSDDTCFTALEENRMNGSLKGPRRSWDSSVGAVPWVRLSRSRRTAQASGDHGLPEASPSFGIWACRHNLRAEINIWGPSTHFTLNMAQVVLSCRSPPKTAHLWRRIDGSHGSVFLFSTDASGCLLKRLLE